MTMKNVMAIYLPEARMGILMMGLSPVQGRISVDMLHRGGVAPSILAIVDGLDRGLERMGLYPNLSTREGVDEVSAFQGVFCASPPYRNLRQRFL